jgi:hypothetical protein
VETPKISSYKAEALRLAKPGQGELIINRTAKTKQDRIILDREIKQAEWVIDTLGGDIELPAQKYDDVGNAISAPDFIWNNEEWEFKILRNGGIRRLEKVLRKGNHQSILKNIIVDIVDSFTNKELIQVMEWTKSNRLLLNKVGNLVEYLIRK